jgi:hypothetical protein
MRDQRGSTESTADPFGGRWYLGGLVEANAAFTVFREVPVSRAISEIDTASPRSRRISAHSFTLITRSGSRPGGQNSPVARWSVFSRRRHDSHGLIKYPSTDAVPRARHETWIGQPRTDWRCDAVCGKSACLLRQGRTSECPRVESA